MAVTDMRSGDGRQAPEQPVMTPGQQRAQDRLDKIGAGRRAANSGATAPTTASPRCWHRLASGATDSDCKDRKAASMTGRAPE